MKSKKAKSLLRINLKFCFILILSTYSINSQQIDSTLHKAYRYNSGIILDEFFMNWENDSRLSGEEEQKISSKINSDDTLKEVYKIANLFYKYLGREEKYCVIEDTLKYEICYSDTILSCDTYSGKNKRSFVFFPFHLDREDSGILYLNSKYNGLLQNFFSSNETDIYKLGDEYEVKRRIFEGKIGFYCKGSWGIKPYKFSQGTLYSTHLSTVIINKELNKAILTYIEGCYYGNTSLWEKTEGYWEFVKVTSQSSP